MSPKNFPSLRYLQAIIAFLVAGALAAIWVVPGPGFHHTYSLGIFSWLLIGGEDPDPNSIFYLGGREYVPNLLGLALSLLTSAAVCWVGSLVYRLLKNKSAPSSASQPQP